MRQLAFEALKMILNTRSGLPGSIVLAMSIKCEFASSVQNSGQRILDGHYTSVLTCTTSYAPGYMGCSSTRHGVPLLPCPPYAAHSSPCPQYTPFENVMQEVTANCYSRTLISYWQIPPGLR